jgi:hypothetical protein
MVTVLTLSDTVFPPPPDPPPDPPLPKNEISVAGLSERSVGIGDLRGLDFHNGFEVGELKAIRLDALVRYDLWGNSPGSATESATFVSTRLLEARDALAGKGVLRLHLENVEQPTFAGAVNAWRAAALYRVLYEFPYKDAGGAESLIARIPIEFEPESGDAAPPEETVVTDELTRWDDLAAPPLVIRGPYGIGELDVLSWFDGQAPSASVSLTRTFDGAPGPPVPFDSSTTALDAFLDLIAGPAPALRHGTLVFETIPGSPALASFLDAIGTAGPTTALGDWNEDGDTDLYAPRTRTVVPPVLLPELGDRLEITYGGTALDQPAVVYLRATRG